MEYLSISRINLYLSCPLKYRFQYIDKLPKPFISSALVFGTCIHSALAWFHEKKKAGIKVNEEDLIRTFQADWYARTMDPRPMVIYKGFETKDVLLKKGKILLSLYAEQYNSRKPNGVELKFEVPIVDTRTGETLDLPLFGFIDLVENGSKADTVVEFKTAARSMDKSSLRQNLQVTGYAYAYEMLFGKAPALKLINLLKTKKPKIQVLETEREKRDFRRFFSLSREVLKGIEKGVFYPKESWMCNDCEYGGNCEKWL